MQDGIILLFFYVQYDLAVQKTVLVLHIALPYEIYVFAMETL